MKEEIKQAIQEIKDECLIALIPNVQEHIKRTDEIRLADILWLVRCQAQRETDSKLCFSEGMKEVVVLWDLEHDDLSKQFDTTILCIYGLIFPPTNVPHTP